MVGGPPQFRGSGTEGWLWTNHEYVSNSAPTKFSAPNGQQMTLARKLQELGILRNDVASHKWETEELDLYARHHKKQVGGSWYRVRFDPAARRWSVVRDAANLRYDATSDTLVTLTGQTLSGRDHDDSGKPLEEGVVAGIMADCAGGQTPWGTIFTAEETVQDAYGDFETAWTENGQFVTQAGFDPGGFISPYFAASPHADFGRTSKLAERHQLDGYGYLVEIDPGAPPGRAYRSVAGGATAPATARSAPWDGRSGRTPPPSSAATSGCCRASRSSSTAATTAAVAVSSSSSRAGPTSPA